jgi:hypothetical protein
MLSNPADNVLVVNTALPSLSGVNVTVPSIAPPEVNVTVPVGEVPRVLSTVATISVDCPAGDGFTNDNSVTVEGA